MGESFMNVRSKRLAATVVAAAAIIGLSNAGLAAEETESLKELVVTGSRIATPELESMTPVSVLSNQAIEA
jgi:outer membrane cobalamin receptor